MLKPPKIGNIKASKLCGKGFFPEELPPCFTTINYGKYVSKLNSVEINALLKKEKGKKEKIDQIDVCGARYGGLLRRFSVPSPLAFSKLALEIERSSCDLQEYLITSKFSASQPTTAHNYRALGLSYRFNELDGLKGTIGKTKKWLLKTDIAHFFPSIYTHIIPWALHGKSESKKLISSWDLLGNRLDKFISDGQYGETKGIPIGPDCSRLISEIVLCSIDKILHSNNTHGFRYMDDFWIFSDSKSEAEEQLGILQIELMKLRLNINPRKTESRLHGNNFTTDWVSEFSKNISANPHTSRGQDTFRELKSLSLSKYSGSPALKYIFRSIRNRTNRQKIDINILKLLIEYVDDEPALISDLVKFIWWNSDVLKIKTTEELVISKLQDWVPKCIRLGYQIELTWLLWCAIEKKWKIPNAILNKISLVESDFISLLLLTLIDKRLCDPFDVPLLNEANTLHGEEHYNSNWLFRYECSLKNWIDPTPLAKLGLESLRKQNISFFRSNIGTGYWQEFWESDYI